MRAERGSSASRIGVAQGWAESAAPRIAGLATAVPPHVVAQDEAMDFARSCFGTALPDLERLLPAFLNAGVESRRLARPAEWYRRSRSFSEKNDAYLDAAFALAKESGEKALVRSGVDRKDIGTLLFVSSTGVSTPSLDAHLVPALELSRSVARMPLWGLGCAGGAAGLGHAAAAVRGTGRAALLISVEICSVTFMHGDRSKANLIATALFGDGAAAAVVTPDGEGPTLTRSRSYLLDDSTDVMGWSLEPDGLRVIFARSIPHLAREMTPELVLDAAGVADASALADHVHHYALHPGGSKVLDAFADTLSLGPERLAPSRETLRRYGNMSSPTVLFVLDRILQGTRSTDQPGLLMALGPGFSAETVLFRW